jgi:uncharacterized membrane protein (TIGR02234 family)
VRSGKPVAVLLVLGGGLLAVLAGSRTWATAVPAQVGAGLASVPVGGRDAAPGSVALGLVAAAGAIVLVTSGRVVRYVVAVLLVAAGVGIAAGGMWVGVDRAALVADALGRASGTTGGPVGGSASATAWPLVAVAAGVLVLAGALVSLAGTHRWDAPSRRFDVPAATDATTAAAAGGSASDRDRAIDTWDALSVGADPTDDAQRGSPSRRAVPRRPPGTWQNDTDPGGDP